jgi:hypothetical protein
MNQIVQKIKKHIRENKAIYISNGLTAVSVTAIFLAVNKSPNSPVSLQTVKQIAFRAEANQVMINLIERSTPSKPVHLVGTNLYFDSLNDAARKTGHSLSQISKVVNGLKTDINGDVFELLTPA